jgi:hypothetical protein
MSRSHYFILIIIVLLLLFPHKWIIKLVLSNYTRCKTLDSGIIIFFRSKFINLAVESVRRKNIIKTKQMFR